MKSKSQNQDMVFRKIKGRIVPIRVNRGRSEAGNIGKGVGLAAAGVATTAAGAFASSKVTKAAATMRKKASWQFKQAGQIIKGLKGPHGDMFREAGATIARSTDTRHAAVLRRWGSVGVRKFRRPVLIAGGILGASLAARGAEVALGKKRKRELGFTSDVIKTAAASGAAALGTTLYYKGLGLNFRKALKYSKAMRRGTLNQLPKIPIETDWGQLAFKF